MRLLERLENGVLKLTIDLVDDLPAYAILSHIWGDDDQEVTFQEMMKESGMLKVGYHKLDFCAVQAWRDGL